MKSFNVLGEQAAALSAMNQCILLGKGSSMRPHSVNKGEGILPVQVISYLVHSLSGLWNCIDD